MSNFTREIFASAASSAHGLTVGTIAEPDRVEGAGADFHERARALFLDLAAQAPERYLVLPARESVEWIAEQVRTRVGALLSEAAGRIAP